MAAPSSARPAVCHAGGQAPAHMAQGASMRLGLQLGYWMMGPEDPIDLVLEAEKLGFDSVWTAEAYGSDAISYLCWMGARTTRLKLATAVMQMAARTPACAALTAATLDQLSKRRPLLRI